MTSSTYGEGINIKLKVYYDTPNTYLSASSLLCHPSPIHWTNWLKWRPSLSWMIYQETSQFGYEAWIADKHYLARICLGLPNNIVFLGDRFNKISYEDLEMANAKTSENMAFFVIKWKIGPSNDFNLEFIFLPPSLITQPFKHIYSELQHAFNLEFSFKKWCHYHYYHQSLNPSNNQMI